MSPPKSKIFSALRLTLSIVLILITATIAGLALWYRAPGNLFNLAPGAWFAVALWVGYVGGILYYAIFSQHRPLATGFYMLTLALMMIWWTSIKPQNYRYWMPEFAQMGEATLDNNIATIKNVRNFRWETPTQATVKWETRTYNIDQIKSVDLFLSYWGMPAIAHVLISFGFENGDYLTFSAETRKQMGQEYSNIAGFFKDYELSLLAADERDIIHLRTNVRGEDVYRYPIIMPEAARKDLFLTYLQGLNTLRKTPRFYNTLTANCTTTAFAMAHKIDPGLPLDYRIILSGYLPEYLHDHVAPYTAQDITTIRTTAAITERAQKLENTPAFSRNIRK